MGAPYIYDISRLRVKDLHSATYIYVVRRLRVNDLYPSHNIVRVIKSRRMRWAGQVALMRGRDAYTGFWWGNLKEGDHLEDPDIDGRILRWIFWKWDVGVWTGSS